MKLLSLAVEHFRCVRKARVEFKDGLNVLYGPNDLGKSSLAHAIRVALLLQDSSSEHREFVNWSGSGEPHVELAFESEPQRIWRVRKTFGGTGQSYLDESRNGVDFTLETRGRDVDGRLSEILRWGLVPPGGKGRPRGMPMTFLSAALLAEQDRVAAIFGQALGNDSDESGRKSLVEALQAMAEDPMFKAVLARVQDRVDAAYTAKGGKRIGKNSPWVQLRDEIRRKEEGDRECKQQAQATEAIEIEIQKLRGGQLESRAVLEGAQVLVGQLTGDLQRKKRRQEIVLRLEERKARLSEITGELDQLARAEKRLIDGIRQVAALAGQEEAVKAALRTAYERVQGASEELARVQSEDSVRERLLKQSTLETRRADLRAERSQNLASLDRIRLIEAAVAKVRSIESEIEALSKSAADLRIKRDAAAHAARHAAEEESELRAIGHLFRWRTAKADLDQAERSLTQLNAWREEAAEKRASALVLEEAQPRLELPSSSQLDDLRRLESDRRVAEAKLAVGLSATLIPKRRLRVGVQTDGGESTIRELAASPLELSAVRQMRLEIEDVAEIVISGGEPNARREMQRLERLWRKEVEPLLQSAGVSTLDALGRICNDVARRSREMHEARSEATQA